MTRRAARNPRTVVHRSAGPLRYVRRGGAQSGTRSEVVFAVQQQVLDLLAAGAPLVDSLNAIARISEQAFPSMLASVLVYDPEHEVLRRGGSCSLPESFVEAVDGLRPGPQMGSCGTAAFCRARIVSEDIDTDPVWVSFREFAAGYRIVSAWSSPVLGPKGELLGVFGMYYQERRVPSPPELDLVDHLVHLAAIAIGRSRLDAALERRAATDDLTGLGNRARMQSVAEQLSEDPINDGVEHVVAIVDLDHFHLHNLTLGQRGADALLVEAGFRLNRSAHGAVLRARLGGDQFVVVLPEHGIGAQRTIEGVLSAIADPFALAGASVGLSASAGLAAWRPRERPLDDALFEALEALGEAKRLGRARCVSFGDTARTQLAGERQVARLLARSLADGGVEPHLQPIVRLTDGAIVGFEVLARLVDSSVPPGVFLPVAEENGLIHELGQQVLAFASRVVAEQRERLGPVRLSVNVSIHQLLALDAAARLVAVVERHGVAPASIDLEVTESHWLDADTPARDALHQLREAGFGLVLDDFGTGYASLSHLQHLPFERIKVDRSFVDQLGTDRGRALCEVALAMAKACGLSVTAEGVADARAAESLRDLGYETGQGFLWSPALPLVEALRLLPG